MYSLRFQWISDFINLVITVSLPTKNIDIKPIFGISYTGLVFDPLKTLG